MQAMKSKDSEDTSGLGLSDRNLGYSIHRELAQFPNDTWEETWEWNVAHVQRPNIGPERIRRCFSRNGKTKVSDCGYLRYALPWLQAKCRD